MGIHREKNIIVNYENFDIVENPGVKEETISSSTYTIDSSLTNVFKLTLSADTIITLPQPVVNQSLYVYIKQDSTGNRSLSWDNSNIKWTYDVIPIVTKTANKLDIYSFISDGVYWYGCVVGQSYSV